MAIHDGPDHRYLFVSPSYERLARSRGPFLGKTFSEVSAEAEEVMVPLLDRVRASEDIFAATDLLFEVDTHSGREPVRMTFALGPLLGPGGEVERILVIAREAPLRGRNPPPKRAQRQTTSSGSRSRRPWCFEQMSDPVVAIDLAGFVTYGGPAAPALCQIPAAEAVGRPLSSCYRF